MDLKSSDLYKKHDQLIELKKITYEKLYNRCKNSIKLTAATGELLCIFEIPNFMFGSGYPIINIESCAKYIMSKLVESNKHIKTSFIEPNYIFIDWRRETDLLYESEPNPFDKHNKQINQLRKLNKRSESEKSSESKFYKSSESKKYRSSESHKYN